MQHTLFIYRKHEIHYVMCSTRDAERPTLQKTIFRELTTLKTIMRLCVHLSISTLLAQRPKIADFTCSMPFQSMTPANLCTICSSLKYRDANFLPLTILACTIRYDKIRQCVLRAVKSFTHAASSQKSDIV